MKWLLIACLLLAGCINSERAVRYLKQSGQLADTCMTNFPNRSDTTWLPGELSIETQWMPGDTLYFYDTITKWQVCPPNRVVYYRIIDTLRIKAVDSSAIIAATFREKALRVKISEFDSQQVKLIDRLNKARKMAVYSLSANVALILLIGFVIGKRWN